MHKDKNMDAVYEYILRSLKNMDPLRYLFGEFQVLLSDAYGYAACSAILNEASSWAILNLQQPTPRRHYMRHAARNGQHTLTAPIQRRIKLLLRTAVRQCLASCQHSVRIGGIFLSACGQEKKTKSDIHVGSFSRGSRRRTTYDERETAPLLHALL